MKYTSSVYFPVIYLVKNKTRIKNRNGLTKNLIFVAPDVSKRDSAISGLIQLSWLPTLIKNCTGFSLPNGMSSNLSVNSIPVNIKYDLSTTGGSQNKGKPGIP